MTLRIVLAILLLLPCHAYADPQIEQGIDRLAGKNGIAANTPGVAVAIIEPGQATIYKTYGLAHLGLRMPITSFTTFELASLSKPITSLIILMLCDRGLMSVNDRIRKHVPELPVYHKKQPILVRDLLNHVSGIPDYFDFDWPAPPEGRKFLKTEDIVKTFAAQRDKHPAVFAPGAKYEYCNSNYCLLAVVASRVANKPWGQLVHDEILEPQKMKSSFVYDRPRAVVKHPARGFVNAVGYRFAKKKQQWELTWSAPPFGNETNLIVGDGGVWSSVEDMEKWDAALRADKFLKKETMTAALTPSRTKDGKLNDYGYGWDLTLAADGKVTAYGHSGSWSGFRTVYHRDFTTNRSYIILSNRGNFGTGEFLDQLKALTAGRKS